MQIEFDVNPERIGDEDATARIDAKIASLRQMVIDRPGPELGINSYDALQWQRRFMAHYGKVIGYIEGYADCGRISIGQVKLLEQQIKTMLQYHMGVMMVGR